MDQTQRDETRDETPRDETPPVRADPAADSPSETTLAGFARQIGPQIEACLEGLLPASTTEPTTLHEAMRYVVFPGGKRLRPLLALLGCKATGGDIQRALPAAAAIELLHCYSLVHDDLPCMDDDDLRRGRPTCHKVYGEAMAVLCGDALLTLALGTVAQGGTRAVEVLAAAAGSLGMVGGQVLDLASQGGAVEGSASAGSPPDDSPPDDSPRDGSEARASDSATTATTAATETERALARVRWIHDHKTGALITASLLVGAHAGGGDLSRSDALREYGDLIGRAFQIADDCLDLTGTEKNLGKRPGQDLAAEKLTYPAVMGLTASREEARSLVARAEDLAMTICSLAGSRLESTVPLLRDAARSTVHRGS